MKTSYLSEVEKGIKQLTTEIIQQQQADGRWNFCFECGIMTDAYMILLLKLMEDPDQKLVHHLVERIRSKQDPDGAWRLYQDEKEGNLSATIEACLALLYAGAQTTQDSAMKKAKEFVQRQMGKSQLSSLTKVVLALFGHMKWSKQPRIPVEFFLLPTWAPVNFFDFVGFTRVHIAPIMIVADRQISVHLAGREEISRWLRSCFLSDDLVTENPIWNREELIQALAYLPFPRQVLHQHALKWGERFILQRIEKDGTLYSYFSSTFLMIFALLSLGYSKHHPTIQKAIQGAKSFYFPLREGGHLQETTSTVWDTSLILYALQEAGIEYNHSVIQRGVHYLLKRQHTKLGDWSIRNPNIQPGGWGFSDINTMNPDVDDTAACLRALAPSVRHGAYKHAWNHGVQWLLSMQNLDGGWSAFEKNTSKRWVSYLPYKDSRHSLTDPSTIDLTGRTLEWMGQELKWKVGQPIVDKAVKWLFAHQKRDGSWFGRWGVAYIYGTWAALTGLAAVGVPKTHPLVQKGINWILSIQNEDGGWGESCQSDQEKKYVSLKASTPSQTAWALDALIAYHDHPTPQINAGIECLLRLIRQHTWATTYSTGAGLTGQFYIHYHSYRYIWPLVTLAHYQQKYG